MADNMGGFLVGKCQEKKCRSWHPDLTEIEALWWRIRIKNQKVLCTESFTSYFYLVRSIFEIPCSADHKQD